MIPDGLFSNKTVYYMKKVTAEMHRFSTRYGRFADDTASDKTFNAHACI